MEGFSDTQTTQYFLRQIGHIRDQVMIVVSLLANNRRIS